MPSSSNCELPTESESSSLFMIGGFVEEGILSGVGSSMRKRQVVLRRTEEPSRTCTSSSLTVRTVRYGECQKNHAAGVGGYAVDGCREFMASNGDEGSNVALTCAACGCHRNFHRRVVATEVE